MKRNKIQNFIFVIFVLNSVFYLTACDEDSNNPADVDINFVIDSSAVGPYAIVTTGSPGGVFVISMQSETIAAIFDKDFSSYRVIITHDGAFAYVTNSGPGVSIFSIASKTVIDSVIIGGSPSALAITPNDSFVYVLNSGFGNVSVISTASNTIVATIDVGLSPHDIAISRMEKLLS